MDEILHPLGCKKAVNNGGNLPINWCMISSINSTGSNEVQLEVQGFFVCIDLLPDFLLLIRFDVAVYHA